MTLASRRDFGHGSPPIVTSQSGPLPNRWLVAAETIRRYLDDQGGETEATVGDLLTTFHVEQADARRRDRIPEALREAGVEADRPLDGLSADEPILLFLADRASEAPAEPPPWTRYVQEGEAEEAAEPPEEPEEPPELPEEPEEAAELPEEPEEPAELPEQPTEEPKPEAIREKAAIELNRAGAGVALAGAALMVIAVFLPRFQSEPFLTKQDTLIQAGDGWPFLVLGAICAATIYGALQLGRRTWVPLVVGLVAMGLGVYNGTGDRLDLPSVGGGGEGLGTPTTAPADHATPGAGIYVAGAGGLLTALGGSWLTGRALRSGRS
jgi:hypothetical protein